MGRKMEKSSFGGDKKLPMNSLLARYERKFIDRFVPRFPKWIEGYHLTLTTVLWSFGLIVFGWLSKSSYNWLWGSSLMLALQWFTDSFDGALGRYRDTGIPKWGYYMDHLLDFVFMSSLLIGYSFLFDGFGRQIIYLFIPISGCFMVSSYLAFGASGEFKITYLGSGPTEIRIYFVILNICIILFGVGWIEKILVYVFVASIVVMFIVIGRTQKYIWKIDMSEKKSTTDDVPS
jgi:archaetidylinositol phosphate synthase